MSIGVREGGLAGQSHADGVVSVSSTFGDAGVAVSYLFITTVQFIPAEKL
jgi:hypothetical protein